jgi:hypothetical protein
MISKGIPIWWHLLNRQRIRENSSSHTQILCFEIFRY